MTTTGPSIYCTNLQIIAHGELAARLDESLDTLTLAVNETSQPGSLTLKITITPGKYDPEKVEVKADISTKLPEPSIIGNYFTASNGLLCPEHPNQGLLNI